MTRAGALVCVVLLIVGAACGGDDVRVERAADRPTTTSAVDPPATTAPATTVPPTTTAPVPAPAWERCGEVECATIATPLDHDDPAGATIDLFATRLPARGDRLGALFVNFGGPGADAADRIRTFRFPDAVRERFDVVAVDPRGVGGSTALGCGLPPAELYGVDPTVEEPADAEALVAVARRQADDCATRAGHLLPHVGTRDVARDLDRVRAAMGDEQLSYLGFSYGTAIGQAYAELFPERVRAMVLDGVVDPAPTGIEVATQQARGFEVALDRWAAGCGARETCRFEDPVGAVEDLLELAEAGIAAGDGRVGAGEAAVGLAYPLYSVGLWDELDRAVADGLDGDGRGMLGLARGYHGLVDFAPYFAVSCLDSAWPATPEAHLAAAEDAASEAPRFGEAIVNDYLRCAVWSVEPDPLGVMRAAGSAPILVVSTTGDPATPHGNAVAVAGRLAQGVLLTHEGDGHTIVFRGSDCVDGTVLGYLVDLVVPADGARC